MNLRTRLARETKFFHLFSLMLRQLCELEAVHIMRGKQKGLRIKILAQQSSLFDQTA